MTLDQLLERLHKATGYLPHRIPTGYLARCPAHDDRAPSLSISEAGNKLLLFCHANCDTRDVIDALDLKWADLYLDGQVPEGDYVPPEPEAVYHYTDERGSHLYDVLRYPGKVFYHKFKRVPYRLQEVIYARELGRSIYIAEGEKDVEALRAVGKTATCNSGGADAEGRGHKWLPEFAKYFIDAKVIIVQDKDEPNKLGVRPGEEHARFVAHSLINVAKSIHVVEPREGKDASDHLAAGHRAEDFVVIQEVKK